MIENFQSLLMLYLKPVAAISRILDGGRIWFALVAALVVSFLLHAPGQVDSRPIERPTTPQKKAVKPVPPEGQGNEVDESARAAQDALTRLQQALPAAATPPGGLDGGFLAAAEEWIGTRGGIFTAPGAIALAFIPLLVAMRAVSGFGSFGVLMRSDYISLLMCALSAWVVAYLPVAIVEWTGSSWLPPAALTAFVVAANLYFLVLSALSLRTLSGSGFVASIGLVALAAAGAIAVLAVYSLVGSMRYYLLSPFFLFYGYSLFRSDFAALGDGLRSRQSLKRQLEISTNNPRDADAHYQLGLIYQKRRQFSEAKERFERAIAIDKTEADPYLQLGRIALEQDRASDAVPLLETAARLDDKASSSEVWRELGVAYLRVARTAEATQALAKYADRRPYDPEGLFYLGKSLAMEGRKAEAKERFTECIEAVKTAPGHRRAHIRKWAGQAQSAMKELK